jgi:predicted  nucleic acid-binding Zn-ribbon protein
MARLLASVLLLAVSAATVRTRVTPVEKVIELLKGLEKEIAEEGKAEAAAYDKYACFCKEQADEKLYQIEKSTKKIEALEAKIAELDADIAELNGEITTIGEKIADLEAEIKEAVEIREKEHAAYVVEEANVSAAIAAVDGAIEAMQAAKGDMEGNTNLEAALVQVRIATGVSLMEPGENFDYTYHSNDIIATLESLRKQFIERKNKIDKEEFDLNADFESRKLGLDNQKKFAEEEKTAKEMQEAEKSERKAAKEKDANQETSDKAADQSFLDVLTAECETKANLWDQRSKTRAAELTALGEALEALETGVKPNWGANKKLSFLQLRGSHESRTAGAEVTRRAIALLQDKAAKLGSSPLSLLVLKAKVSEDHFVKVRGLIKDLIARLKQQAEDEAEQKSFCDKSMKAAIDKRDSNQEKLEDRTAQISATSAEKAQLEKDIASLSEAIAANAKALAEATELRTSEKAENEKTISDATEGEAAVDDALKILNTFYDGQGALLQFVPKDSDRSGKTVGDLAPDVFDSEYNGKQQQSKGVVGLLEVIKSDFARTIETTTSEEAAAQAQYEEFKKETEDDTAAKEKEVKTKTQEVKDAEAKLVQLRDEKGEATAGLANANEELEKLHTMCVAGEETYEERVAKREKEIEALKEAQRILEEWQS